MPKIAFTGFVDAVLHVSDVQFEIEIEDDGSSEDELWDIAFEKVKLMVENKDEAVLKALRQNLLDTMEFWSRNGDRFLWRDIDRIQVEQVRWS